MHRAFTLLPILLLGCAADLTLLAEPGALRSAYREEALTYDPGDGARTLRVAVWYPTEAEDGPLVGRYDGVFDAADMLLDAPVAPGAFPLVVYSHGHQGYAESSARIIAHLVSHGAVVVAPEHLGNTWDTFTERTTDLYWKRPADLSAALDHLQDPAHPLAASLDDGPVTAIGHSFGGYTLHAAAGATFDPEMVACGADGPQPFCSTMTPADASRFEAGLVEPRIRGYAAMAPGDFRLFGTSGLGAVEVPVLLMTGGLDDIEQGDLQWSGLDRAGNTRIHLDDAGHLAFSDFASESPPNIAPEAAWSVLGAYLVGFVRQVQGDRRTERLFDGREDPLGPTTTVSSGG